VKTAISEWVLNSRRCLIRARVFSLCRGEHRRRIVEIGKLSGTLLPGGAPFTPAYLLARRAPVLGLEVPVSSRLLRPVLTWSPTCIPHRFSGHDLSSTVGLTRGEGAVTRSAGKAGGGRCCGSRGDMRRPCGAECGAGRLPVLCSEAGHRTATNLPRMCSRLSRLGWHGCALEVQARALHVVRTLLERPLHETPARVAAASPATACSL
jgi:hypothetical protein